MYKEVRSNQRKTWFLITFFLVFIIGLGFLFSRVYPDYNFILPLAVILAVGSSWFSYFYSDKIVLRLAGARQIKPEDFSYTQYHHIFRLTENLSITAGLPTPRIFIIDSLAMNAFATGRDPAHSVLAVTRGLVERLENEELEGVIAHELSHIKNYDIRLSTIVVTMVGVVALMSDFFLRFTWLDRGQKREGGSQLQFVFFALAIILSILAPVAALLVQLAISRKREFLADADAALLTRFPEGLARALEKINLDKEPLKTASTATAHLYITNPFKGKRFMAKLFSTHPAIEERVKVLRAMGAWE